MEIHVFVVNLSKKSQMKNTLSWWRKMCFYQVDPLKRLFRSLANYYKFFFEKCFFPKKLYFFENRFFFPKKIKKIQIFIFLGEKNENPKKRKNDITFSEKNIFQIFFWAGNNISNRFRGFICCKRIFPDKLMTISWKNVRPFLLGHPVQGPS